MRWTQAIRDLLRPKEYFERTLRWHEIAYERLRNERSDSMLHTVLAKMLLLWERENPGPSLVSGVKDLAWAYGVTRYFACLPPNEAVQVMAIFMAAERHPSCLTQNPESMPRYSSLMATLSVGVESNTLIAMYKKQNLEPINEEKEFYDRSVKELFIRTVHVE